MQIQLLAILTSLNGMATLAGVAHIHPVVVLAIAIVKAIEVRLFHPVSLLATLMREIATQGKQESFQVAR